MQDFLPVAALPQWELNVKVAQLLGLQGPWQHQVCRDTDCLRHRSYGPIRVFSPACCSWRSEGLLGQSFSLALPVQALKRLPCLGSFSVVPHVRHIEGPSWLESYSVDWLISHLKEHPRWGPALWFSASCVWWASFSIVQLPMLVCGEREAMDGAICVIQQYRLLPWLPSFPSQAFPTTISSLISPQSVSPQSTAALALGLFHNP